MCELLVAAFEQPRPFRDIAPFVLGLERYGLGGFGWGVAWLDEETAAVGGVRGLGRYRDEGEKDAALLERRSARFLVHLRRPSKLSTVQMADTQPFFQGTESAWCHNGFLERAEEMRPQFAGRLAGRADSEVGWQYFLEKRGEGLDVREALRAVDDAFSGKVNLAYLDARGELSIYSRNETNRMWRFSLDGGEFAATDLHSDDGSLFDLVVPEASERRRVEPGSAERVAGAFSAAATSGTRSGA